MKSIDVPVSHEELVIERQAVTGDVAVDSAPIADETIRIPLTEEQANISKETVVREEVEIGKRRIEDVEHISEAVRNEKLRVDDAATDRATSRVNLEKLVTTAGETAPALVTMQGLTAPDVESEQAVCHERVQKRAYALWEVEGRPEGRQLDHWTKAELELYAMRSTPARLLRVESVLRQTA
jgi:uncharacterized protein (TIGR02271 family)